MPIVLTVVDRRLALPLPGGVALRPHGVAFGRVIGDRVGLAHGLARTALAAATWWAFLVA